MTYRLVVYVNPGHTEYIGIEADTDEEAIVLGRKKAGQRKATLYKGKLAQRNSIWRYGDLI